MNLASLPWAAQPGRMKFWVLLVLLGLSACGDSTRGSSTPAAMEAPRGTGSSGVSTATPAAADTPAGGSSGHQGMPPVPDSSGGPPSGGAASAGVGSAPSRPAPGATTSTPEPGSAAQGGGFTAQPGLPARQTGQAQTQGSTNSTPSSSTGNASR